MRGVKIMDQPGNSEASCPHYMQELVCPIKADRCPCPGRKIRVSVTAVQERECKKWAHEWHDGFAQIIGGVNLEVEALIQMAGKMETADLMQRLTSIRDELKICQSTIREIIEDLRSPYVSGGLLESLIKILDPMRRKFEIEANLPDKLEGISLLIQVDLFRIVQEALININKYSQATKVWVNISLHDNFLELLIKDNGCGFDPIILELEREKKSQRFGLLSMKERTEILGGVFLLKTNVNAGTTIKVTIPKVGIMGSGIKWLLSELC